MIRRVSGGSVDFGPHPAAAMSTRRNSMNTRRKSHCASAAIATALSCCVLLAPVQAMASDSVERWNIAMTDYSAGQPPPGIPPFVEVRVYAMAHIAMLEALLTATASSSPANVDA